MRKTLFLLLFFSAGIARAQDLTGIWHGHFRSSAVTTRSSPSDERYKFEVQISQHEKKVEAITYSYLSSIFYGKAAATGAVNPKNGKLLLQETKLLEFRNQSGEVCIMTCFLQYSKVGDEEYLEGNFVSMNMKDSTNCGKGVVFLRRVIASDFYTEPFVAKRQKEIEDSVDRAAVTAKAGPTARKQPTVKAPGLAAGRSGNDTGTVKTGAGRTPPPVVKTPPPATKAPVATNSQPPAKPAKTPGKEQPKAPPMAKTTLPSIPAQGSGRDTLTGIGKHFPVITPKVLLSRSNVLVKTIVVHSNEIELNIYDDGAIDHDTISVYLDKKQVINHAMLTDRPLVLTIHLDESNDYHELVMVAENEGEIPPNTSLMIVKAGDREYEVRITSTEQKNAMVIFKFEKK